LVVTWQRLYEELLPALDALLSTLPGADQQQWGAAAQAALGTAKLQSLACLRALLVASTTTTAGAPTDPRVPSEHGTWADTVQRLLTAPDGPADGPHAGAFLRDAAVLFGPALRTALTTDTDDSGLDGGGGGTGGYLYETIVASSADAAHTASLLPERLRQHFTAAPAPASRSPASATSSSSSPAPAPAAAASAAPAVGLQDPSEAVRALKDLFPAYGDGFLLACLAAFDHR